MTIRWHWMEPAERECLIDDLKRENADMLEALQAAAEALLCTDNKFEPTGFGGRTALQVVEAAIAKATGGA